MAVLLQSGISVCHVAVGVATSVEASDVAVST